MKICINLTYITNCDIMEMCKSCNVVESDNYIFKSEVMKMVKMADKTKVRVFNGMKLKQLIEELGVSDLAPIHFFEYSPQNGCAKCMHITYEEVDDYRNNCWSSEKEYNQDMLGVYLADITVGELYDIIEQQTPATIDKTISDISNVFNVILDYCKIIFATHVILHEIGHWIDFKNSGMTRLEYYLWNDEASKEYKVFSNNVRNIPDSHLMKYEYIEAAEEKYRNIPSERAANDYVISIVVDKLNILGVDTYQLD